MKTGKAILYNFLFLLIVIPFLWFAVYVPQKQVDSFISQSTTFVKTTLNEQYPSDLIIKIDKGEVSINQDSPYCLVVDKKTNSGVVYDKLATTDMNALDPKTSKYSKLCQPVVLVGKDFVMYPKDGAYQISKISPSLNYTIDKKTLDGLVITYLPIVTNLINRGYWICPFVLVILAWSWYLSMNIWYWLITKLAVKLFKVKDIDTTKLFGTTLMAYTLLIGIKWIVIDYLINNLAHQNITIAFPFMNTILIAIISIIYLKKSSSSSIPTGQ